MTINAAEIANTMRAVLLDDDGTHIGTTLNPLPVTGAISVNLTESTDMFGGGVHPVTTVAVAATITGVPQSIIIRADPDNAGRLYVGKSDVDTNGANALTVLDAGESFTIDYNDTTNAYYVVANTATTQQFWKGALL